MSVTACSNVTKVVRTTRVGMSRQIHVWKDKRYGHLYPDFNDNTVTLVNHNTPYSQNASCVILGVRRCSVGINISFKGRRTNKATITALWVLISIPPEHGLNTVIEAYTVGDKVVEWNVATHYLPNLSTQRYMVNYILKYNDTSIIVRYIQGTTNSSSTHHLTFSRNLPLLDSNNINIAHSYSAESIYFEFKVNGHKCFGELMGIY